MSEPDRNYEQSVTRALAIFKGKWTIQILCAMRDSTVRLSQLKRLIPLASKKALTASLRTLEKERVIIRRDLSATVLHVEYGLRCEMREQIVAILDRLAGYGVAAQLLDRSDPPAESDVQLI